MLYPVILSGGAGSRLWPVSREAHPKPFMTLPDGQSLLEKTLRRAARLDGVADIMTVTNRELFFATEDLYQAIDGQDCSLSYILEPFGRNTSAAIGAAALQLQRSQGDDAVMLVMPADHLILDESAFAEAVRTAQRLALEGWLVTFGIKPRYPETGFGYIEADRSQQWPEGYKVSRFVEKPNLELAQAYLDGGKHFWNAGIFCFTAGSLLEELGLYAADILERLGQTFEASRLSEAQRHRCLTLDAATFAEVPAIAIDYALLERSNKVAVVPCDMGWSDIGSWNAMSELTHPDSNGNRCIGEIVSQGALNNFIHSPKRLTALVGVQDLMIIDTPDALLIAHKDHTQDVKHIVGQLKRSNHAAHLLHRTVHRPWGSYTVLEEGDRFKIKRIKVKPGAALSLQRHQHRSEHWIVVSGVAQVINGEQQLRLNRNESTFIPAGHTHRLANPGTLDLLLIEVQSGDYLGEDDILRFPDPDLP